MDHIYETHDAHTPAESKFTGTLLGLIGINLLASLIILCTFGIATPWAICIREKWVAEHTFINGRQLTFDGTGAQLFGNYIKWFLLCLITLGIYSLWMGIRMKQWVVKHTHFAT